MNRFNQILIVILVVQIVLAGVAYFPRVSATEAGGGPLFADLEADKVKEFTVTDNEGKSVAVAKRDGAWVLPNADDFPTKEEDVTAFLEKLEALQTNRLVTKTDTSHRRLKVAAEDFERLVEFTLSDGEAYKLYVGSSAGAAATHVRADGESSVYLTGELTAWDAKARASEWIDTLYFTLPTTAPLAITLENEHGAFEFEKDGENWTMKGLADDETFKENNLKTMLNRVTALRMTEPVGKEKKPEFGIDNPQAVITIETANETYTLTFGDKYEDTDDYMLKSSASDYYVRVGANTGDAFVNKKRDDFLELPPTPAPTAPTLPEPKSS